MVPIKRIFALLLALTLALSLAGCGGKQVEAPGEADPENALADATVLDYNAVTGAALADGVAAGTRPVAVMVNNARASLPQRGVSAADAVVEMLTEGGITRLMALYANPASMPTVGSVRSARDQHLQFALPLNAIVVHIGGSVYAENLLNTYSYADVDGRYLGNTAFAFDATRAAGFAEEHCWFTDGALTAAGVSAKGIETTGAGYPLFEFMDYRDAPRALADGDAPAVAFSFSNDSPVEFDYDAASGRYLKQAYGAPHTDEDGTQLSFDNVLVLFAETGLKPDGYCTDFNLVAGSGYYLYGGKYQAVYWYKGNPESPLTLTDLKGNELKVNVGKSYLGVVGYDRAATLQMNVNAAAEAAASTAASAPASTAASAPASTAAG